MEVRRLGPKEEERFLELEREAIYPDLSQEAMEKWIEGEGVYLPLLFVLEGAGEIIGGAVFEIQDHLGVKEVLLQLDALFVLPEYRRQGLGTRLLSQSLFQACDFYWDNGLSAVSLLIQTTSLEEGAVDFYRKFCEEFRFPYNQATQKIKKKEVTVFLISLSR